MKHLNLAAAFLFGGIFMIFLFSFLIPPKDVFLNYAAPSLNFWPIRSIDTMKYSRDLSREKMNDSSFDETIDKQVRNIAAAGATHVAIATPYDKEFVPMLTRWVLAARKYKLNVWFRGNLSGWEGWFDYESITRAQHIKLIGEFIASNPDLFQDGDIFSSCPECENGGPGDPRRTGGAAEYRKFLIQEYQASKSAFAKIGKRVDANYFSMNGDMARLIMDKKTTAALDGAVVIDHYVKTPEKLLKDAESIASQSGGKVVLGEFGAPIPDIHGKMTPEEQSQWISKSLVLLAGSKNIIGINYWLSVGGSTEIWDGDGKQLPAAETIREFYKPETIYGIITDSLGNSISGAEISNLGRTFFTDKNGYFEFPVVKNLDAELAISAENYISLERDIKESIGAVHITLDKKQEDLMYKMRMFIKKLLKL